MKRFLKILGLGLILITGITLYACGAATVTPKISIENAYIELRIGEEGKETKSVDVVLSEHGSGSAQVNFSTDSAGLVVFSSEYISGGKTRLTVTGIEPGTATITVRSLQGGATKTITVKVIQPITGLSLKSTYAGKLYGIKGSSLNLNTLDFYSFVPEKTNEKDLQFEIKTLDSGCSINNGILYIGESVELDKITVTVKSKNNTALSMDFDVKILKPISATLEVNYTGEEPEAVSPTANNYLKLYPSETDKSSATAILTITAGSQTETLKINQIFNAAQGQFSVSQTNYQYNSDNGTHVYTFTIQANSIDAGKIDSLVFSASYENYTIGANNYNVKTNKLNINSYNTPTSIKVNNDIGETDIEVFKNSTGKLIEITVLPGYLESGSDKFRIWTDDYKTSPISIYRMSETRNLTLVYGYDLLTNKMTCTNNDYNSDLENPKIPYYEATSGAKLYALVNKSYSSTTNNTATFYAQSSKYYSGGNIGDTSKVFTKINFDVNPNAENIYLAEYDSTDGISTNKDSTIINVLYGQTKTQYIAIAPSKFVIGGSSSVSLLNTSLATLGELTKVSSNDDYVYAKFTIQGLKLGSTVLTITLSDGKTKKITLNVVSVLEELDINIEDLSGNVKSDIIAFTNISDTRVVVGGDRTPTLNKISIANSGSSIQFLKTASPSSAQYSLKYNYYDMLPTNESIESISLPDFNYDWKTTSSILNATSMNNFSIIEPLSSRTEGNVLLRIDIYGMTTEGTYSSNAVGSIYYLINFFVPVASLNVTNGTVELYPYESIGDLFVNSSGQNKSTGSFSLAINSTNGSVNPTYINTLQVYVNGGLSPITFTNDFCYLTSEGYVTYSSSNAALKIIRTLSGNVYTFNLQSFKPAVNNFVFTFVVKEVNNRKITGIARVFIKDVVEISDIELVNISEKEGLYFENQDNSKDRELEIVTNIYSATGKEITNKNLHFEFEWGVAYNNGTEITDLSTVKESNYVSISMNKNGNYVLTIDKKFSGKGTLKIYAESNYFTSDGGWNGEGQCYEIEIIVADGRTEDTAINIGNETEFFNLLKESSGYHYKLQNNLSLSSGQYIETFDGHLDGNGYTISTNSPIFGTIDSGSTVKNLNIIALPSSPVECKYISTSVSVGVGGETLDLLASGFLACINEGTITDVNIEGNTYFDKPETIPQALALGLLIGVNTGTIEYKIEPETATINIDGINNGINGAGATYAGGIAGFNTGTGTIKGAHVAVTVVGTYVGNFAGNEGHETYKDLGTIDCTYGLDDVTSFNLTMNPNSKNSEDLITNEKTAILYYYEVIGAALTDAETNDLKTKRTFDIADLFSLSGQITVEGTAGNTEPDLSLFNITSSNSNVLKVVSNTLEINGIGKVTLTITPKYSSETETPSEEITIYVIYPINTYNMYEGIKAESGANKIQDDEKINIKKSGTHYFTISTSNVVYLNYKPFVLAQNNLAVELFVGDSKSSTIGLTTFTILGTATNYNDTNPTDNIVYTALGTISLTTSADSGDNYYLFANLVLQNSGTAVGIWKDDIDTINSLLKSNFSKQTNLNVYVGAEKIQSSIISAEVDPSNVLTSEIVLTTDNKYDGLIIKIYGQNGELVWSDENGSNIKNIFEVRHPATTSLIGNKIKYKLSIYIQDSSRSQITKNTDYVVYVYAASSNTSQGTPVYSVYLTINLTVKPQEVISVTYSHHNRADSSTSSGLTVNDEPSSVLAPGDSGLLKINLYPTYATYNKIVIESATVDSQFVLLEQMYLKEGLYLTASGASGYVSSRENNKLTIYYSDGMANDNGMVYIRTKVSGAITEGLSFPITITIYGTDENGNEKVVKSEQIILMTQVVDGAIITINDEHDAVVVRGHDNEIKISVPIYQDLSDPYIVNKELSDLPDDDIRIYFNRAEYEIVNNRKVYTGTLSVGLNAELTGDGVFGVQTVVSRIINGREETTTDTITLTVVDFVVKGIYIEGNNESDNVFETPLAIEKELKFKFDLSDIPSYYNSNQEIAVKRITAAQQYFLDNMAYKYANDAKYLYLINTDRVFVTDNTATLPIYEDATTHVVSSQAVNSIATNLYYSSNLTSYITQPNNYYVSIIYNTLGTTNTFESNLLKVTGTKVGEVSFTIRMGYQLPGSKEISYLTYTFIISVKEYSDEDSPIAIKTKEDFISYLSDSQNYDKNYILMNDITLTNFTPFESTYFNSLDGNNKVITIESFNVTATTNLLDLALFKNVASGVTVKNLTVNLYELADIIVDESKVSSVNIAGLAVNNSGIIYNCEVISLDKDNNGGHDSDGGIRVYFSATNKEKAKESTTIVNIAGLVVNNNTTGCITNSRVGGYDFYEVTGNTSSSTSIKYKQKNINITGQGNIAGFVLSNKGVISASYFANGNITNKSLSGTEAITSGFVVTNDMYGSINGCYTQGIRLSSDLDIYATGGGIVAQGIVSGFIYENEGHITDSYSNIRLAGGNTGRIVSGFVYNNKSKGLIERCYASSTIIGELTTQMPFTGISADGRGLQEGELVNCYYIVRLYSSESILENQFSTGAVGLGNTTLSEQKLYGFAFSSVKTSQDGSWYWNGAYAELIEANNIAISARYIIENYTEASNGGGTVQTINAFPYIKGYEYGSSKNPIIIRTADEYNRVFGQETNLEAKNYYAISQMYDKTRGIIFGSYRLVSHIDFNDLTTTENVKVTSSIMTLTQKGDYKGVFDGNGLTISNIEITLDSQQTLGLISKLSNSAVFKNVNLTIIKVTSRIGVYVGGAIGQVENSFAINISVVPVTVSTGDNKSYISGYNIVGGVIGFVSGKSRLSNLSSSISVISLFKQSTSSYDRFGQSITNHATLSYAGGVVGIVDIYKDMFDSSVYDTSKTTVNKLKTYGENISIQGEYVGGVAGYVGASTYFVDALFEITGKGRLASDYNQKLISYGSAIGGVVGVNYGTLFEIRVEHEYETQLAIENALQGYYTSTNIFRGIETLFNNFESSGTIKYIGGLVGKMMDGELTTSYAKVDVTSPKKSGETTSILAAEYAGGLIGYNKADTTFYELFAFGDVDAKDAVGGLIGYNEGNANFSLCVAMNYYRKDNSKFTTLNPATVTTGTTTYTVLKNIGSIIGKDSYVTSDDKTKTYSFSSSTAKVFGVTQITISGTTYYLLAIGSYNNDVYKDSVYNNNVFEYIIEYISDTSNPSKLSDYQSQPLTITGNDISKFNKTIDTITANEMFINAGWDNALWVKENDRIFPYFNFGLTSQVLYIEKPSDLVKLYRYSNQSNTVIFGNDPTTVFDPYKYVADDESTYHEFTDTDLKGLTVINNGDGTYTLIYDISELKTLLEGLGLIGDDCYFDRFLGRMYGELDGNTYLISGIKKTLFQEVIGGSISNLAFSTATYKVEKTSGVENAVVDKYNAPILGPVLAEEIYAETQLSKLTFQDTKITSAKNNIGIMAETIDKVTLLKDITITNCTITSTYSDSSYLSSSYVNVGGVTGQITGNDGNYSTTLTNVKIQGVQIFVKGTPTGEETTYASNANVGLIFGQVGGSNAGQTGTGLKIYYSDCIIEKFNTDTKNVIDVNVKDTGTIYAGGYAGYASNTTQSIINTEADSSSATPFISDLYIVIGQSKKVVAGLLFGQANISSLGNGETTGTNKALNITLEGIITNTYKWDIANKKLVTATPTSTIAVVGGAIGQGSGDLNDIEIKGIIYDNATPGNSSDDTMILIDLETKTFGAVSPSDPNAGISFFTKVGGAIGYAPDALNLTAINVSGNITVANNNATSTQLLAVGGLVGYTGNTFTILKSGYKNYTISGTPETKETSQITVSEKSGTATTVYVGGIVGFCRTNSTGNYNIGKIEGSTTLDGATFEGEIVIDKTINGTNVYTIKTVYAGGIVGSQSDATTSNPINKLGIYDSKVSGNITVNGIQATGGTIVIGGVAGYIVADMIGNYAWGDITLADNLLDNSQGLTGKIWLGGIVGQLEGIDNNNNNKASFDDNNSLTAIYNENRSDNHLIRALIAKADYVSTKNDENTPVGNENPSNRYCHQINLCVDGAEVGQNLYYKKTAGSTLDKSILGLFSNLVGGAAVGSKLNPIDNFDYNSTTLTFESSEYYVLTGDVTSVTATSSRDVDGHLIGDGYTITTTNVTPFSAITSTGSISGVNISNTHTSTATHSVGFATTNNGIVFACNVKLMAYSSILESGTRYTINTGFIQTNNGLIADCGALIYGGLCGAGFCTFNSGVISNSYVTGSLTTGVIDDNDYKRALFAGASGNNVYEQYSNKGTIINCYVALKSSTSTAAFYGATVINCYYDRTAAEKELTGSTEGMTTDQMARIDDTSTDPLNILSGGNGSRLKGTNSNGSSKQERLSTWTQNYVYNFGYPTLSTGAYTNFTYMKTFFGTGGGNPSSDAIQLPNAGKLKQLSGTENPTVLGRKYQLVNSVNLANAIITSWTPIGITTAFTGTFDGNNYSINGIAFTTSSVNYAGFFSKISSATIKNCTFNYKTTVSGTDLALAPVKGTNSAGGVVGYVTGGTSRIENVQCSGASVEAGHNAGGIVGLVDGSNVTIKNVTNGTTSIAGFVSATDDGNSAYAGGIIGYFKPTIGTISETNINYASVTSKQDAGGIVGCLEKGTIGAVGYTTTNKGAVSVSGSGSAGGIAGWAKSNTTINYCENQGTISGLYAGGIAGYSGNSTISYCKNEEYIRGNTAGGIAGYSGNSTISYCKNNGYISVIVIGGGIVGEMVDGSIYGYNNGWDDDILYEGQNGTEDEKKCENKGSIEFSATTSSTIYMGGIVGKLRSGKIQYCRNLSSIYATGQNTEGVTYYVGGTAGYSNGIINNCYQKSNVSVHAYKYPDIRPSIKCTGVSGLVLTIEYQKVRSTTETVWAGRLVGYMDNSATETGNEIYGYLIKQIGEYYLETKATIDIAKLGADKNSGTLTDHFYMGTWNFKTSIKINETTYENVYYIDNESSLIYGWARFPHAIYTEKGDAKIFNKTDIDSWDLQTDIGNKSN